MSRAYKLIPSELQAITLVTVNDKNSLLTPNVAYILAIIMQLVQGRTHGGGLLQVPIKEVRNLIITFLASTRGSLNSRADP